MSTLFGPYTDRIERLKTRKREQTLAKKKNVGFANEDDFGIVLPPDTFRFTFPAVDANGFFTGIANWATNYAALLDAYPLHYDADDIIAGKWMFILTRMRTGYTLSKAPFPFDFSHLHQEQELYDLTTGIGKDAHFAPDHRIGLSLGWEGIRQKILRAQAEHRGDAEAEELLAAEIVVVEAVQRWIRRCAACDPEPGSERQRINFKLVNDPPSSLREACQWMAWYNMAARSYNKGGAGCQLDAMFRPFYERDLADGAITRDDAAYFLACFLLNDPRYYAIGGADAEGRDTTCELSFLLLEITHELKTSSNLTIRVHRNMDRRLFRRGVEVLLADRLGYPRFSCDDTMIAGFMRNGYSRDLAATRIPLGCSWSIIPGREYTLNDVVKINLAKVFSVAFDEIIADGDPERYSTEALYEIFLKHLQRAVKCIAAGLDFHLAHQYRNESELLLNLLCHGPIEKGRDAAHGGVEFYNMCCDGAGLATVADSLGALQTRIEQQKRVSWNQCVAAVKADWQNDQGEAIRRFLASAPKFGFGGSPADAWAKRISQDFTNMVKADRTPGGRIMIPGLFSWADAVRFGKSVPATPNGRRAGEPISHGANPDAGFRHDGAATAIVQAVAGIQCGYGNTAPLQMELDASYANGPDAVERVMALFQGHFDLGGTLINVNFIDATTIRAAEKDPEKYPDLVVRVTGFTAYFIMLSPEFRKLVTSRILEEAHE